MPCPVCSPTDASCLTANTVLPPCTCAETPATREEGPPGAEGAVGDTPAFLVGTVTEGAANVILTENDPLNYTLDFVLPQPPINTANVWTELQTFDGGALFTDGLELTGGAAIFGGASFAVTPNATFGGTVSVAGDETVTGTLTADGDADVTGDLTVGSGATLNATQIDGAVTFGSGATIAVDPITGFVKGRVVLDSCNKPKLVPNRGSDLYSKADQTGLTVIGAGLTGQICTAIVINNPISGCTPQLTPVVDVMIRVSYNFAGLPNGQLGARLWKGAITTGTKLDDFEQGTNTFDNANAGMIILQGQIALPVGNTSFFVEVLNGTDQDFTPTQVTSWITN